MADGERKRAHSDDSHLPFKRMCQCAIEGAESIVGQSVVPQPPFILMPAYHTHPNKENMSPILSPMVTPVSLSHGHTLCLVRPDQASPRYRQPFQSLPSEFHRGYQHSYGSIPQLCCIECPPLCLPTHPNLSQDAVDTVIDSKPNSIIYKDMDTSADARVFSDTSTAVDALPLEGLSLSDALKPNSWTSPSPQMVADQTQASLYTIHSSIFEGYVNLSNSPCYTAVLNWISRIYDQTDQDDILLLINKGSEAIKSNRHLLSNASQFFAAIFADPLPVR